MDLPVETFLESLRSNGGISEKTVEAYGVDLSRFVKFFEAESKRIPQVDDYTPENLTSFLQRERKAGRGTSTLMRRRATLRRLGAYLAVNGLSDIDISGETLIKKPNLGFRSTGRRKPGFLQEEDIRRLYDTLDERLTPRSIRDKAIMRVLLETGISIGTLVAIDIEDFEADRGRIFVKPDGFDEGYWLQLKGAFAAVRDYLKNGRPDLTDSKVERALFVSQMGGRLSRQSVWQTLQNWGRKAKCKIGLTPSVMRYTAALQMYHSQMPITEMQQYLGHRNILSTHALLRRLQVKASR